MQNIYIRQFAKKKKENNYLYSIGQCSKKKNEKDYLYSTAQCVKKKNEKHYLYSIGKCPNRKIIFIRKDHVQKKKNDKHLY